MHEPIKQTEQDRNGNGRLRVIKVSDDEYYVESSKGKVCYKVVFNGDGQSCTCGDFTSNIGKTPNYSCKHIRAIIDQDGSIPKVDFGNRHRPKLDDRFLTTIQGKDFALYSGLLDLAHQKGLRSIKVEALQFPSKENGQEAICRAEVESPIGEIYVEYGDASPNNVNRKIALHVLRMAATRAKARALRDYTNIGITSLEELGDMDDVITDREPKKKSSGNVVPITEASKQRGSNGNGKVDPKPKEKSKEPEKKSHQGDQSDQGDLRDTAGGIGPSTAQIKAMENLAKRRGISRDEMEEMAQQMFGASYKNITASEAANFIRSLQQSS